MDFFGLGVKQLNFAQATSGPIAATIFPVFLSLRKATAIIALRHEITRVNRSTLASRLSFP
jgi:hypothetical protein